MDNYISKSGIIIGSGIRIGVQSVSASANNKDCSYQNKKTEGCKVINIIPIFHGNESTSFLKKIQGCVLSLALLASPSYAQDQKMELLEPVGSFQINRVAQSKVCFATYNGASANGIPSFFATYKLVDGDRWQVTGYTEQKELMKSPDVLTISFDGEQHMISDLETTQGSFFMPFLDSNQLQDFDAKVEISESVTFSLLRSKDSLTVNLPELRAAKAAIDICLQGLK